MNKKKCLEKKDDILYVKFLLAESDLFSLDFTDIFFTTIPCALQGSA